MGWQIKRAERNAASVFEREEPIPHISPIVAQTRIGANWRLESCRKDRKPHGCRGCGRTRHPWGSRLLQAGRNEAREVVYK